MTDFHFLEPQIELGRSRHHAEAAIGNVDVTTHAIAALRDALSGDADYERILLKAAAGAGKSHALKRMVDDALNDPSCTRVGVTAFANKQVFPLAYELGKMLGKDNVCLLVAEAQLPRVSEATLEAATVVVSYKDCPPEAKVLLGTTHKLQGVAPWLLKSIGAAGNGEKLFDVLFVDEAWQLPLHRYAKIDRLAPIDVGVGDVGQLPPLDPSQNPWRGDPGHNPYRAWPTSFEDDEKTWAREMPAVWRPTAAQLPVWRAFYGDWDDLNCVAGPGDRELVVGSGDGPDGSQALAVWSQVGTGVATLVEVEGLPDAEAPDVDMPLMETLEGLLDELLTVGFEVRTTQYDGYGIPDGVETVAARDIEDSTVIAVLATRNQAVDDAQEIVDRLREKHDLPEGWIVASTVDSWQGQTNVLTVALHPLSGASSLDEFNSAFGRLAVTCTRATHGLLLLARAGLDDLLAAAPARPGTPLGEPGTRQLPRQTHRRIVNAFARGTLSGVIEVEA
ncbi:hypothetical protein N802_10225 [Knoellia sinensis KCTC 19936]|uniref:AAA domain-containing protein n=1 Tax=Knoellia sinensis KCTC 19936 TaxID=1385520 RepID=A0A0A0J2P9_9MICO|nr:hypothetical protein [Knoellia sinensis]KGN29916.1 hypothetical protein N802_10225 [Knoellia sinensis KCTC 19936]